MIVFVCILLSSNLPNRYALIGVDCFSKLAMMGTTQEQSAEFVYATLQTWFEEHGVPKIIYCDNGGPFKNKCTEFLQIISIITQFYIF